MTSKPPSTKSPRERREEARRRQQQQRTIILGVIALVAILAVVYVILQSSRPASVTIPEAAKTAYASIISKGYVGTTPEGFFYVGKADAPAVIEEYASYSCVHCEEYHTQVLSNIKDKIEAGQAKVVYIPLTSYGSFDSTGMSKGSLCAGLQEPGKFWQMHDIMFAWQGTYGASGNSTANLLGAAQQLGLDTNKFSACLNGTDTASTLKAAVDSAAARNVQGTPTIFVNGQLMQAASGGSPDLSSLRGIIESLNIAK